MSDQAPNAWFHCNRYSAQAACEHCGGAVHHELWCMTLNTEIFYAYKIVVNPSALTVEDALILHSLGAAWSKQVARVIARPAISEPVIPQTSSTAVQEGSRSWRTNRQGKKL